MQETALSDRRRGELLLDSYVVDSSVRRWDPQVSFVATDVKAEVTNLIARLSPDGNEDNHKKKLESVAPPVKVDLEQYLSAWKKDSFFFNPKGYLDSHKKEERAHHRDHRFHA